MECLIGCCRVLRAGFAMGGLGVGIGCLGIRLGRCV